MPRRPNRRVSQSPVLIIAFTEAERALLKLNTPGPSMGLGGYAQFENWIVLNTDDSRRLGLPPAMLERLIRYCREYGSGGPNNRIRAACLPALKRAGITVRR